MRNCICQSPNIVIKNTHYKKRDIDLTIIGTDKGIVLFEKNEAIATFDANYCPVCGKKLD